MAKSFRDLEKEGAVKRADARQVRAQDIHERPGFNLREEGEDLEASIDALADHIADGGQIPALEVQPREEGGVWVVDGHRRRRAIHKLIEQGRIEPDPKTGEYWVSIVPFSGNDVDRLARVMTSNDSRTLTELERAEGYKRLAAFGLSATEIAKKVRRSRPHVEQMLILANANHDVQTMVREGKVTASSAIDVTRKHGENAGKVLADKLHETGGEKLKQSDVKGKPLPRKVVEEAEETLKYVAQYLTPAARHAAALAEADPDRHSNKMVEVEAGLLMELLKAAQAIKDAREKQAEKAAAKAQRGSQESIDMDDEEQS